MSMSIFYRVSRGLMAAAFGLSFSWQAARAETINQALELAYSNNPTLNAQRAATRAADEGVPIAKSGYRPFIFGVGELGSNYTRTKISDKLGGRAKTQLSPYSFGLSVSQTLWDSFKTFNNVQQAEAAVRASRETLRNTEQNVLFDAASAYMNVIRDEQIVSNRKQSLAFLAELVRSEKARFEVGESTRTDVAQAEARQANAQADLSVAIGQLESSKAVYQQIIGRAPQNLRAPKGVDGLAPKGPDSALKVALNEHPALRATESLVDQAAFRVKSSESDLLPTVTLNGSVSRGYDQATNAWHSDNAQVTANLNVPIYQGGQVAGQVRQNKELLGQARIQVDETVDSIRAAVFSSYSQLTAARASLAANREQLKAAKLALESVVEERKVGQRTTLDVLDTQQDVIATQISLAQAERDVIVAGYAALSASGRLTAQRLNLKVAVYQAREHYEAVEDKWFGLRTPDAQR